MSGPKSVVSKQTFFRACNTFPVRAEWRNMERVRPTFFVVIALLVVSGFKGASAFAQTPQDWALCLGGDLSTPDLPIEGCRY